ncbi:MAG: hypothetical protein AAF985_12160 [Bacteroidota bacterium]
MATNRFSAAARKAADLTNKQLATEIAAVGNLSRDRIHELLPKKKDKQAFVDLMKEVEAETTMDQKITYLQDNIQSAGKVAFTLLKALV